MIYIFQTNAAAAADAEKEDTSTKVGTAAKIGRLC